MHILLDIFRVYQVRGLQFLQLGKGEKLKVIVDDVVVLLFEFLCYVLYEGTPLRCWVQLRNEIYAYSGMLLSDQIYAGVLYIAKTVDFRCGLNAGE